MQLTRIKKVTGIIKLRSGLHIGGSGSEMHIGGIDTPVIRHPHTNEPYIPGSSLKGKIRSLLELRYGLVLLSEGRPVSSGTLSKIGTDAELSKHCRAILKTFGSSGAETDNKGEIGPTRVAFSDCMLDAEWKRMASARRYVLTEEKAETAINRISGTAAAGSLRQTERVPEGAIFSFLVTFKVLQEGDENIFDEYLLSGLKLLELDALGGSGSRGYGRIRFENLELDGVSIQEAFDNMQIF